MIKKIQNFWYHHKLATIIVVLAIIFLIVATIQMTTKDNPDINILYAGPFWLSSAEIRGIENAFIQTMSEDYNGDGKNLVVIKDIILLSDKQIDERIENARAEGIDDLYINRNENLKLRNSLTTEIMGGESIICLLDPAWYDYVNAENGFMPLVEILGYKPENAFDDYGIYLKDTEFGKFFTAFQVLPDDTILCMRRMTVLSMFKGTKKEEERYNWHVRMFADILDFKVKE